MTRLAVVTPSFQPDFDLFRELHDSVTRHGPDDVLHHAIVPSHDVRKFSSIRSTRLVVWAVEDVLPPRFVSTYRATRTVRRLPGMHHVPSVQAVNLRRPWPPVRGWILQQVVKLAVSSRFDVDVVLTVDSDVCFIRQFTADTFSRDGTTRFYRRTDAISEDMIEHRTWHCVAQRLLGLAPDTSASADYIAPLVALDPRLVRAVRDRVETVQGRSWLDVLAGELSMSEFILYGRYVDRLAPSASRSFSSGRSLCLSRWTEAPLGPGDVAPFLDHLSPGDVAVHVQSTLEADRRLRRAVVEGARARAQHFDAAGQGTAETPVQ